MTTLKTSTLTDAALDWAVTQIVSGAGPDKAQKQWRYFGRVFNPSTEWSQGGPIIEREAISLRRYYNEEKTWVAEIGTTYRRGPTILIAAMRCFVASNLGDTVDVPPELA